MADNQETNVQIARNTRTRENFISECRDSRIVVEANLSPRMRQIYRRHFDGLSRSVYLLRYYSRVVREPGVEVLLIKEIMTLIEEVNDNLNKKIQVADSILVKENIKVKVAKFEVINVTIIDPIANFFLKSFVIAQELDDKLSALWLSTILDDSQRTKALAEIENELRSIQGKCRHISMGLRDRARAQRSGGDRNKDLDLTETVKSEILANAIDDEEKASKTSMVAKKPKKPVGVEAEITDAEADLIQSAEDAEEVA